MSDLETRARQIRWYHTIELAPGVRTRGLDRTAARLRRLALPEDLRGQTVLDVGAWDGFFSFEAERRGAARVLATDFYSWHGAGWGTKQGFLLARQALGSKVEDLDIDVFDISPATVGTFDVVLFLGVLYHVKDPLGALERMAAVTGRLLIVESAVDLLHLRRPAMAFYPGEELNRDASNWWGPNPACLEQMLRVCGFREVRCVYRHPVLNRAAYAAWQRLRRKGEFLSTWRQGRAVFHALR